jgi:adenylyltransferase/sulfurtransferase
MFCGITPAVKAADRGTIAPELETTVEDLKTRMDRRDVFLLDVREPREWDIAHIEGATLIPLGELPKRMNELPKDQDIIVQCKTGVRSAKAVNLLRESGFDHVQNLKGGIIAWISRIDPSLHSY